MEDKYIGYYVRDEETYAKVFKRGNDEIHYVCHLPEGGIEQLEKEEREKNMNNIEIFKNNEFGSLRTLMINDEPWFIGKDVADALGYKDHKKALRTNVDKEDKDVHSMDTLGGIQNLIIINESGLYSLILGSKLKKAKKFKHWVTSEVLPSIRKNGNYQLPTNDPMKILELTFQVQKNHDEKINTLESKVKYLEDDVLLSPSEYSSIASAVNQRVNYIKETYSLTEATKPCMSTLYKAINHDIKRLTGAYNRSQIRRKDFAKVMEFIRIWTPDNVVNYRLKEMLNNN